MSLNNNKIELLAPAGTKEAFVAAVQNGADAVYLGAKSFSARAGATNFDNDALVEAVKYAHMRGVKVFVTLNTLIKQSEMDDALKMAEFLYNIGVDAIIIQDLGLASLIMHALPDVRLHASTQMTIHSVSGAKKLEELGFKRVVLARELSYEQIKQIKEQTSLELEIFVHGAICNSYSGQCLFSSYLGGRSGNRGRCAQPCRLPYELKNGQTSLKKGYLLSPKDMCLLSHMDKIKELGIDSLKIEGRLKRPEYVATVTRIYKKYLSSPLKPDVEDVKMLLNAFNRSGFTDGYFTANTGGKMMSFDSPSNISEEIFAPDIKQSFAENANFRRVKVRAYCAIKCGQKSTMTLSDDDKNTITAYGAASEMATNTPLSYERAYTQLSKFGSVPFELEELVLDIDEGITLPISEVNALRRAACDMLIKKRENVHKEIVGACSVGFIIDKNEGERELNIQVNTIEQAKAALSVEPAILCAPEHVIKKLDKCKNTKLVTKLDAIVNDEKTYKNIITDGVLCSSLGSAYALGNKHTVYGNYRINVYNDSSVAFYLANGFERVCLSPELSIKDMASMSKNALSICDVLVYGHIPLMTMKNCVIKSCTGNCSKNKGGYFLTDRKNEAFPIICQSKSCTNLLLNAKPTYMADKLGDLLKLGIKRFSLMFTIEDGDSCRRICDEYARAIKGEHVKNSMEENKFTRAHFYRGVL